MIKDILLNLSADVRQETAENYAISVAGAFGAHLAAMTFAYDPVLSAAVMGDALPVDFINAQRALVEEGANAAATKLSEVARRSGISVETQVETTSFGAAADIFGQFARRFDLSIVSQANPDVVGPQNLIIEAALFQSGRPVVVVPYIQKTGLTLDRVLVCWDGGRQAARAIADALPFLHRAKAIEVVTVATEPLKSDDLPDADIARHLARHDLKVDLKRIVRRGIDVADSIVSYAADVSADFIVMGRIRPFAIARGHPWRHNAWAALVNDDPHTHVTLSHPASTLANNLREGSAHAFELGVTGLVAGLFCDKSILRRASGELRATEVCRAIGPQAIRRSRP